MRNKKLSKGGRTYYMKTLMLRVDYFSPMIPLFQMWPGYGVLVYEGLNDGHIMDLKVLPASTAPSRTGEFYINF